jgi:ABC-type glycerol-3-phosphate transport system substrate-binding protein
MKVIQLIIILLCVLCIYGCGVFNIGNPTIHFWTNREEFLPYIEEFNKQHTHYKVELSLLRTLNDEFLSLQNKPDLILCSLPEILIDHNNFDSLDGILSEAGIENDEVYQNLLKIGVYNGNQVLLPYSFDIPAIVFTKFDKENLPDFSLSLDDLKKQSAKFTVFQGRRLKALGFSPLWNHKFLFYTSMLFGADFRYTADNILIWDENALNSAVDYLRTWINDELGGYAVEREFSKKYIYEPPYKLVQDNKFGYYRIGFFFTTISEYYEIPQQKRKNLEFRWLHYNDKIPVTEKILVFAVPSGSKNSEGARAFLKWILKPEIQKQLVKIYTLHDHPYFGIANGFSIIKDINKHYFPDYYPFLIGFVPPENSLVFPNQLPADWDKLKNEIIMNWLLEEIARTAKISSLKEKFK